MHHLVGGEHLRPQPLQRVQRSRLPGPDPARQADERNRQADSPSTPSEPSASGA
jgi:hypothetical protein